MAPSYCWPEAKYQREGKKKREGEKERVGGGVEGGSIIKLHNNAWGLPQLRSDPFILL